MEVASIFETTKITLTNPCYFCSLRTTQRPFVKVVLVVNNTMTCGDRLDTRSYEIQPNKSFLFLFSKHNTTTICVYLQNSPKRTLLGSVNFLDTHSLCISSTHSKWDRSGSSVFTRYTPPRVYLQLTPNGTLSGLLNLLHTHFPCMYSIYSKLNPSWFSDYSKLDPSWFGDLLQTGSFLVQCFKTNRYIVCMCLARLLGPAAGKSTQLSIFLHILICIDSGRETEYDSE